MDESAHLLRRDVISARDFRREELEFILRTVDDVERGNRNIGVLDGKLAALLFFEPSTRTYSSFQIAAERLGMRVSGFAS